MESHRITVSRTARYYLEGESAGARELLFLLHGYGQRAEDFLGEFAHLARPGLLLVAPEGLARFYRDGGSGAVGASWMTKEAREDEIRDYVAYLDALATELLENAAEVVRVTALGFSQGGSTAGRWAAQGSTRIDRLVSWAGGIPPDVDLASWRSSAVDIVLGTRDSFIDEPRLERELGQLEEAGVSYRLHRFEGGHRLDRETLRGLFSD